MMARGASGRVKERLKLLIHKTDNNEQFKIINSSFYFLVCFCFTSFNHTQNVKNIWSSVLDLWHPVAIYCQDQAGTNFLQKDEKQKYF